MPNSNDLPKLGTKERLYIDAVNEIQKHQSFTFLRYGLTLLLDRFVMHEEDHPEGQLSEGFITFKLMYAFIDILENTNECKYPQTAHYFRKTLYDFITLKNKCDE